MPAALCKPFITFAALAVLASSAYPAVGADFAIPVEGVGVERLVVDPVLMAELPRQQLDASDHGKPARFEGVWLRDVLLRAGAPLGKQMRGRNVPLVVLLTARDGYAASLALVELDPSFRDKSILLADRRDGEPLFEETGPLQLVVGDEARAGRWIRQIERIEIVDPTARQ
jgi:hypothetical protein